MDLKDKIISATKWSAITELASKLITPISTMALARILTPEDFGVLVTAMMIIGFAEIFTDAGFHKYLIQHEFVSDEEKNKSITVAFWSNFCFSVIIWAVICFFSSQIAVLVGCRGKGVVIVVSCACIPLAAFSSIQSAIFKRAFDFKTLFYVRLIGIMIPLVVTIPLALLTRSYWALIVGMVLLNLLNAIILTIRSPWKPSFFYNWKCLKEMISFSLWSMLESISIWLTNYIDMFIVGVLLNQYFLGIYRTSMSTVGQITSIITSATTPVLFSTLSRLQNNDKEFLSLFFKFQKIVGIFVIPIGIGVFIFRNFVVKILLGNQWTEAAYFVGIWGLTSSITIVLSHYCSEIYRSKGKPKLSVLAQILHIVVLTPVVYHFAVGPFETLCTARALVRMELIMVNLAILYSLVKINPLKMVVNVFPSIISACCMLPVMFLCSSNNFAVNIGCFILCFIIYFVVLSFFPEERFLIKKIVKNRRIIL